MRYELNVRAYDVLDQVQISVHVWSTETGSPEPREILLSRSNTFQGVGESSPYHWAMTALQEALELL